MRRCRMIDSHPTCIVVVRDAAILEPIWLADHWAVSDGRLIVMDENQPIATFEVGDWMAVGEMRLAAGVTLRARDGEEIRHRPELWD